MTVRVFSVEREARFMLRMSTLFLRTLREDPADAELASHRLLIRAGYTRRVAPGIFAWLPLGFRVLRNIERVIREEMDRAGAQEVHLPALLPREPYEATDRWTEYGDNLFRLHDRRGADYLLGPTHEEMFTLLVKGEFSSYRDLPVSLYQIQNKYRDEARPRAGLLRGREFVMKDSYSFDLDDEGLRRSYRAHRDAYVRIFDRLGLHYVIVAATSGAMGGSASEEFLVPADAGEDTFVHCPGCGYSANVEALAAVVPEAATDPGASPEPRVAATPGTTAISDLVSLANADPGLARADRDWVAADMLKNVAFVVRHPDGTEEPLVIGLPGDREVDPKRLEAFLAPAAARPFEDDDFRRRTQLARGYIGPGSVGSERGIRYLVDPRIQDGTAWVTGADRVDHHVFGLVAGRDFTADGVADVAEVLAGDPCPDCGEGLELARGIEVGHIFQLGRKYTEALDLRVLDERGERVPVTMGSYGIGVSRLVASIAEQSHDEHGLIWPASIAPADVHLVVAGKKDALLAAAERLAEDLEGAGRTVLIDDRPTSAGVKFNDAELIGLPWIVVVGRRLADGLVELRNRATGEREDVPVAQLVERLGNSTR